MTGTRLITYEESLTLPESNFDEIVNGELRTMPPTSIEHQELIGALYLQFRSQLNRASSLVLQSYGQAIHFEPAFTYRVPDLAVFHRAGLLKKDRYYMISSPSLLVEVLSPSNRKGNLSELLADYENIGVPEVWLIEPDMQVLRVMKLRGTALFESASLREGHVSPAEFQHISIELQPLWDSLDIIH